MLQDLGSSLVGQMTKNFLCRTSVRKRMEQREGWEEIARPNGIKSIGMKVSPPIKDKKTKGKMIIGLPIAPNTQPIPKLYPRINKNAGQ